MSDVLPRHEVFLELQRLKVADVVDSKWGYHKTFESNVHKLNKKGIGSFKAANLARKFANKMATTIATYPSFRDKRSLENLLASYINLNYHLTQVREKMPRHPENLVYAIWYLNDNEPKVEQ